MQLCSIIVACTVTFCHMRAARQVGVLQEVLCSTGGAARGGSKVGESCM